MKRAGSKGPTNAFALLVFLTSAATAVAANAVYSPKNSVIHISHVSRFFQDYDAADGHSTATELHCDHLNPEPAGLRHPVKIYSVTGKNIAAEIAERP